MKQVRMGVFETNSSSTHSLTICSKADFEAWKRGEIFFSEWDDKLVDASEVKEDDLEDGEYKSFETWEDSEYLEIFIENYKTESGDEIVAFGKYGYNG